MVEKISIIGQARMGAERLPGKVMKKLRDKTVLGHILTRLKQADNNSETKIIDQIIIATTDKSEDDLIEAECERYGVRCFRGSSLNVLDRFFEAAKLYNAGHIMRICCDNPLIDPHIIESCAGIYVKDDSVEYLKTAGLPLGLGLEIFPFYKLEEAHEKATEEYQREHVTPYIIENSRAVAVYEAEIKKASDFRFTLDTEEDFIFISEIYDRLYNGNHDFFMEDVIELLEREPELLKINGHIKQKKVTFKK